MKYNTGLKWVYGYYKSGPYFRSVENINKILVINFIT